MLNEQWKPVKGYERLYEVSNLGRIKRLDNYVKANLKNNVCRVFKEGRILKPI